jgi:ArsR family transcriptional regulator
MEMDSAISALSALAQETRLAIFRALVRAHAPGDGEGGLAAGDIAEKLGVPPATLSFHLKELAHAGLVTSRRDGRSIVYKADLEAMLGLTGFLLDDCCQGACGTLSPCLPAGVNRTEAECV